MHVDKTYRREKVVTYSLCIFYPELIWTWTLPQLLQVVVIVIYFTLHSYLNLRYSWYQLDHSGHLGLCLVKCKIWLLQQQISIIIYTCTFLVKWLLYTRICECNISQDTDTQISERYQSFCFVYKIKAAHCSNQSLH